jgi:single-strand DNA-binding protein
MYSTLTVIGYLGHSPETRTIPSGAKVTNFTLATTRKFTRADGTEVKETTWFTVEAWGKLGEAAEKFLHKGSKVMVLGRLVPDTKTGGPRVYQKRDGGFGASYVVYAQNVTFLDSKGNPDGANPSMKDEVESAPEDVLGIPDPSDPYSVYPF